MSAFHPKRSFFAFLQTLTCATVGRCPTATPSPRDVGNFLPRTRQSILFFQNRACVTLAPQARRKPRGFEGDTNVGSVTCVTLRPACGNKTSDEATRASQIGFWLAFHRPLAYLRARSIRLRPGSRARFSSTAGSDRAVPPSSPAFSALVPPRPERTPAKAFGPAGSSATQTGGFNRLAGNT